jgi:hypothetical protein
MKKKRKKAESQRELNKFQRKWHEFSAGRGLPPSSSDVLAWHEFSAGRGVQPR